MGKSLFFLRFWRTAFPDPCSVYLCFTLVSSWVGGIFQIVCHALSCKARLCAISVLFTFSRAMLIVQVCVLSPNPAVRLAFCTLSLKRLPPPSGTYVDSQSWGVSEVCGALGGPFGQLGDLQVRPSQRLLGRLPDQVCGAVNRIHVPGAVLPATPQPLVAQHTSVFYPLVCIQSWIFFFASAVYWSFSAGLPDFHKGTLLHGWLSESLFFGGKTLENSLFCHADDVIAYFYFLLW